MVTTKFVHTQGQLLEGRLTGNIQPSDPKYIVEGDIYEFSGFSVINNPRNRKLTQLPYYIRVDQTTIALNVTLDGPVYPVHTLVPQNWRNLLRLAITPTYLPDQWVIPLLIKQTWMFILKSMCRCRRADTHNTKKKSVPPMTQYWCHDWSTDEHVSLTQ